MRPSLQSKTMWLIDEVSGKYDPLSREKSSDSVVTHVGISRQGFLSSSCNYANEKKCLKWK